MNLISYEKKEEFIIGQWYQNKNIKTLFIKLKALKESGKIISSIIWSSGKYEEDNTSTETIERYDILKDLKEIKHLLPSNHPDLLNLETINNFEIW